MIALHPEAHAPSVHEVLGWWTWDVLVIPVLVIAATTYAIGLGRLWRNAGQGHGIDRLDAAAYAGGIAALALALLSPLDRASDVLFSAHMAQHELLMLVAAPLVVLGRPFVPMLWSMPQPWRAKALRAVRRPAALRVWRFLTAPVVALVLHGLVRWIWHLPAAFEAALADERVHIVQHVTFFASAALFWWSLVHGKYRRAGYGIAVVFVFFTAMHSGLLAALLSLSDTPWYGSHALRTNAWGLDPVEDQQRAGLLMWIPGGVLLTSIGLAFLAAWLGAAGRRVAHSSHQGLVGSSEVPP